MSNDKYIEMTDDERDGLTVIIAVLNGGTWAVVAALLGATSGACLLVGIGTGVTCWMLLRVFQRRGRK